MEDNSLPLEFTVERWVLKIYRIIITVLQSIVWMLLVFFALALIAYILVKIFELRRFGQNMTLSFEESNRTRFSELKFGKDI